MTVQASVAQIRGRVLVPAPQRPTWPFFTHLVELGDEEAEVGRPALACAWYRLACEQVPQMPEPVASVFQAFHARARAWRHADDVGARRYRAACAVAIGSQ
jgi:hypothetical protein